MLNIQKKMSNAFLALLGLPATAVGFALSTQIAALSWVLSNKYGLDIHDVAFVWLAGPIAGIFGQVIVGMVSDNVWFMGGRRRPFIIIGGLVSTVAFLALPNISGISKVTGITDIILIASVIALFLDLSDEEQEFVSTLRQYPDGVQLNELSIQLAKPISKLSSQLLEMEFKGVVKCLPGSVYKIVK